VIEDSGNLVLDEIHPSTKSDISKLEAKAITNIDPMIFGDVEIELFASLGRGTMTVQEMLDITSGAVIPLQTPLNGLVDLTLNGRIVARGEIVSVDDHFGVRVTEIVANKS
jgi:flagellar motor switch protein FliN